MAENDDELLLGTPIAKDTGSRDSDGDGVSDVDEGKARGPTPAWRTRR